MTMEIIFFNFFKGIQFPSWEAATANALSSILELTLGITSRSSSEEWRLRALFKGLNKLLGQIMTLMYYFICEGASAQAT